MVPVLRVGLWGPGHMGSKPRNLGSGVRHQKPVGEAPLLRVHVVHVMAPHTLTRELLELLLTTSPTPALLPSASRPLVHLGLTSRPDPPKGIHPQEGPAQRRGQPPSGAGRPHPPTPGLQSGASVCGGVFTAGAGGGGGHARGSALLTVLGKAPPPQRVNMDLCLRTGGAARP